MASGRKLKAESCPNALNLPKWPIPLDFARTIAEIHGVKDMEVIASLNHLAPDRIATGHRPRGLFLTKVPKNASKSR